MQQSYRQCSPFDSPCKCCTLKTWAARGARANDSSGASRILTLLFFSSLLAERHGSDVRPRCHAERVGGPFFASHFNTIGHKSEERTCTYGEARCPVSTRIHTTLSAAEQEQLQCTQQTNVHTWAALSPLLSHLTDADEASTLCTFASRMSDMWPLNCKRGKICSVAGSL